ncbi:MAG: helix-turn-helix domain-containing protein [Verrucomicrobiaceae bacterium]|nr:MAG: helix-turn-helix domain-containing protein [Verrucomicrobiaceae bacterium]
MPSHGSPAQSVASRRAAFGWSQAELSQRAGIPRTTISAIEGGNLTPSVTAALALAAALDCTVEELFGDGEMPARKRGGPTWAWQPATDSARYWQAEVGGRVLLYPVEPPASHAEPHDGIWRGGIPDHRVSTPPTTLVLACCDPASGLLASAYARASGFRLLVIERGGAAALELLEKGLVHIAGIHRSTAEDPGRNSDTVLTRLGSGHRLLRVAEWQEGLAIPASEKSRSLSSITRRCDRWALREPGSAARECLDELLDSRPAPGRCVPGHTAVAGAISAGWADAGVCVEIAAIDAGLRFLPVRTESLDLCIPTAHLRDPRVRALVNLLKSKSHRSLISDLPGYDARHTGDATDV